MTSSAVSEIIWQRQTDPNGHTKTSSAVRRQIDRWDSKLVSVDGSETVSRWRAVWRWMWTQTGIVWSYAMTMKNIACFQNAALYAYFRLITLKNKINTKSSLITNWFCFYVRCSYCSFLCSLKHSMNSGVTRMRCEGSQNYVKTVSHIK